MCMALDKKIIDIAKQIESFSILSELGKINARQGWKESNKTLVFGSSTYALNKFANNAEKSGNNIDRLNKKYFFCINDKDFIENKTFFNKIILVRRELPSENINLSKYAKACETVTELNGQCSPIGHITTIDSQVYY